MEVVDEFCPCQDGQTRPDEHRGQRVIVRLLNDSRRVQESGVEKTCPQRKVLSLQRAQARQRVGGGARFAEKLLSGPARERLHLCTERLTALARLHELADPDGRRGRHCRRGRGGRRVLAGDRQQEKGQGNTEADAVEHTCRSRIRGVPRGVDGAVECAPLRAPTMLLGLEAGASISPIIRGPRAATLVRFT